MDAYLNNNNFTEATHSSVTRNNLKNV
uniref:Uncharacterized protein n=1 Tax=Anguilla anguilla TaxID=7936 RepID=A0A0E9Q6T4_ANGAN